MAQMCVFFNMIMRAYVVRTVTHCGYKCLNKQKKDVSCQYQNIKLKDAKKLCAAEPTCIYS